MEKYGLTCDGVGYNVCGMNTKSTQGGAHDVTCRNCGLNVDDPQRHWESGWVCDLIRDDRIAKGLDVPMRDAIDIDDDEYDDEMEVE